MKNLLTIIVLLIFSTSILGQKIDKKEFRKQVKQAEDLYDKKEYKNAATIFKDLIENSKHNIDALIFWKAAVSFDGIGKENVVKNYLFKFTEVAESSEIETLKTSTTFKKYNSKKWWKELEGAMENRMTNLIEHHKNLVVFSHKKRMTYSAIRITAKGDTVANTKIHILPDGTGWGNPANSSQSQAIFIYESSVQDSIDHIQEVRDIVDEKFWNSIDTTGIIENDKKIWMHPFRNNEFFKTELAPFPLVVFPINYQAMLNERSTIVIMRNWGTYSPSMTAEKYFYIGKEEKNYDFAEKIECHKFSAYGHNSIHGISNLEYFFHEKFGFTEMNYLTYDNDVIKFKMIASEEIMEK